MMGMNAMTFDTYKFVKRLTDAGMPEGQAEVLADEQARLVEDRLATKRDLAILRTELTHALTIRLGGMLVTGIVVVATLVRLL